MMRGVPILMYHAFGRPEERPSRFVLPARRFGMQMLVLRLLGFRVISLAEHIESLDLGSAARRTVVLTIDDGYLDNFELAYPILRRHGFRATIFLTSAKVGTVNDWDHGGELSGRPLLDWPLVQAMAKAGIDFGAHTRTHPTLSGLDDATLRAEIAGSRADLERELERPVELFSYPYGRVDERTVAAARDAGFRAAVMARLVDGSEEDRYRISRIEIGGDESLLRFIAAVAGWARNRP
jgi:peptidoglycan/xylan/chitin deacetylase (PgdA/CDA1 family)